MGIISGSYVGTTAPVPPKTIIWCYLTAAEIAANFTSGLGNSTSSYIGWAICNGSNGTPSLNAKFIRANTGDSGATGGADTADHTHSVTSNVAVADHSSHTHSYTDVVNHTHTISVTDPGHVHVQTVNSGTTGALNGYTPDVSTSTSTSSGYSTASATTGITASSANPGGGVSSGTTAGPSATLTHSVTNNAVTSGAASVTENRPAFYELVPLMKV